MDEIGNDHLITDYLNEVTVTNTLSVEDQEFLMDPITTSIKNQP